MVLNKAASYLLAMAVFSLGLKATTAEEMAQITKNITSIFADYYAPKEWKAEFLNWNLDDEISEVAESLESGDVQAFHRGLSQFFRSTRDYHTGIAFANNTVATLPISIKYASDGFYLAYVAPNLATNFPLKLGDKITHINDQNISELAWSLIGKVHNPSLTDWSIAAKKLTKRSGAAGDLIEKGPVIIKAERGDQKLFAQVVWNVTADLSSALKTNSARIKRFVKSLPAGLSAKQKSVLESAYRHIDNRSFRVKLADYLGQTPMENVGDPQALGKKESYLPVLGNRVIWSTDSNNPWQAYIYLNDDNKLVGFIRIASYVPDESVGTAAHYATQFGEIVTKMNELADLLVIDQLNNPGGGVFYLYTLASMLSDAPLKTPRHRFTIDSKDVYEAKDFLKQIDALILLASQVPGAVGDIEGYPIDVLFLQHMKSYYQFIVEQWNAGKTLTDPYFLYGVDHIQPHPKYRYNKKIILLTNELDFSGGDFFPAILQDNERATLLGTTTAGAGGYVLSNSDRNRAGIVSYHYTGSIAFRANGKPLENLGVSPDIEYQISAEDLASGFYFFREKINSVAAGLMKQ